MVELSVIILSYNTQELTRNCLTTLLSALSNSKLTSEVIVIDNASVDDSPAMLDSMKKNAVGTADLKVIKNRDNAGFTKGNNQGIAHAQGEYILFLNSDVTVDDVNFDEIIRYMDQNKDVGAMTVKVLLSTGGIDPASHRGFPTPWNSFAYFSKLETLLAHGPLAKIFGGYHLTYQKLDTIHEIDSPTGAFFLTRKQLLEKLNGLDEHFFMYGEDIDLAYRIKQSGYKIIYYPLYTVTHYKHKSGLKSENTAVKKRVHASFYESMKIFYKKHYEKKYPNWLSNIIYSVIDLKKRFS